jgi:hypothetical protein
VLDEEVNRGMTRLDDEAGGWSREYDVRYAMARRHRGKDVAATVEKEDRVPGVGFLAEVHKTVLDRGRTGGPRRRLMVTEACEDGRLRCSGAA